MKKTFDQIGFMMNAVASLVSAGYDYLFRRQTPYLKGSIESEGLHAPVKVIRDEWGIPHIYAASIEDALFAQGFVHAQDRLWQMDFNRRLVAGRLSEILGEVSVPLDRWMRIIGMRRTAEKEFDLLEQTTQQYLIAYTAGVNDYIKRGHLPIEFKLLQYSPELWTVTDILSWPKMMSWTLSVNWEAEIIRSLIVDRIGAERAAELDMLDYNNSPYIIPNGLDLSTISAETLRLAEQAKKFTGPTATNGIGSNNWVIAGERTTTGMPILANDMHLGLSIPSIWYENHLQAEDLHLSGITFPGLPAIVAGHNQNVAWGFTNGFPDVQDLYVERLRATDTDHVQYEYQGQWLDAQVILETIQIKAKESITEKVVITQHGPIINKLAPDLIGEKPLALRWTALDPSNILDCIVKMAIAKDCYDFREALKNWTSPAQNTVFADTKGNIAYKLPGRIPIRSKGDGRFPVPGWTGDYEWIGFIPYDELPELLNPPQGYIITANNRVIGRNYPYHLSFDYCTGNRAERIEELIQEKGKLSINDIRDMQFDQISTQARRTAKILGQLQSTDPELKKIIDRFRSYDGNLSKASSEAAIYELFTQSLIQQLLKERLGDLAIHYCGKGTTPVLAESSIMGERAREWLDWILGNPESPWYDRGNSESRDEIVLAVLKETISILRQKLGPEPHDWQWGKLHTLTFAHTLGSVKPLNLIFNRGPFALGGDFDTIWATGSSRYDLNQQGVVGPPFRFIADLSNWENCQGLLAPGQSGQPTSPHYADQIKSWFSGDYHPMIFAQSEVKKKAKKILIIQPIHNEEF